MVIGVFPAAKLGILAIKQVSKPIANVIKSNAKSSPKRISHSKPWLLLLRRDVSTIRGMPTSYHHNQYNVQYTT